MEHLKAVPFPPKVIAALAAVVSIVLFVHVAEQLYFFAIIRETLRIRAYENYAVDIGISDLDAIIDYKRCPSSKPLSIYVYDTDTPLARHLASLPYATTTPDEACLFIAVLDGPPDSPTSLLHWTSDKPNHVLINTNEKLVIRNTSQAIIVQSNFHEDDFRPLIDYETQSNLPEFDKSSWKEKPYLLPITRTNRYCIEASVGKAASDAIAKAASSTNASALQCNGYCVSSDLRECLFYVLTPGMHFQNSLREALRAGSTPVVLSLSQPMPFQDTIDWRLASIRFPRSQAPGIDKVLRNIRVEDLLELRRRGRLFLDQYLDDIEGWSRALLVSLSSRLGLRSLPSKDVPAMSVFEDSFTAPITYEFVARMPVSSEEPARNITTTVKTSKSSKQIYSYQHWNNGNQIQYELTSTFLDSLEYTTDAMEATPLMRDFPLGGSRPPEEFTIMILTYNRDEELKFILEGLYGTPYLNKVLVIWNDINRVPEGSWPQLNVPVEFIKPEANSLNNRFIPYDRIATDAVVSIDDDMHIERKELLDAFRIWRQNPDRIVGYPDRYNKWRNGRAAYGAGMHCQFSLMLTSFAFLHKDLLREYTFHMHPMIREHIDAITNCEDIAINYLASHLTRKAPVKIGLKQDYFCAKCHRGLSNDPTHYTERDDCIALFNQIYGYNPLRLSQKRINVNEVPGGCTQRL